MSHTETHTHTLTHSHTHTYQNIHTHTHTHTNTKQTHGPLELHAHVRLGSSNKISDIPFFKNNPLFYQLLPFDKKFLRGRGVVNYDSHCLNHWKGLVQQLCMALDFFLKQKVLIVSWSLRSFPKLSKITVACSMLVKMNK